MKHETPIANQDATVCPCCGGKGYLIGLSKLLNRWPHPSTKFARIVHALIDHPKGRNKDQLIEAMYFDDLDGGPLSAINLVSVVISQNKPELHKLGFDITKPFKGPNNGGGFYRLIQLQEPAE